MKQDIQDDITNARTRATVSSSYSATAATNRLAHLVCGLPVTLTNDFLIYYRLMRNAQNVGTLAWSTTPCNCDLLMKARLYSMSAPPASNTPLLGAVSFLHSAAAAVLMTCSDAAGTSILRILDNIHHFETVSAHAGEKEGGQSSSWCSSSSSSYKNSSGQTC